LGLYVPKPFTDGECIFRLWHRTYINPENVLTLATPAVPDGNFAALWIGWEDKFSASHFRGLKLKSTWHVDEANYFVVQFRPLADYFSEPEKFAQKMTSWIDAARPEIEMIATAPARRMG
jgi:hypothetical protein